MKIGIEQNIGRERKGREEQKEKESIIYNITQTPYVKSDTSSNQT